MAVSPHWRRRSGFFTPDGFEREAWLALNVHLALRDTAGAAWGRSLCVSVLRGVAMKRSLFAAFAVLALALLFVVPASAAPAGRPSHAAVSHVQVAQVAPTATVTINTPAVTTPAVITQTKKDRTGLLGLFGLLGLLGLLKRPRKDVTTVVERPIARPVDPVVRDRQ